MNIAAPTIKVCDTVEPSALPPVTSYTRGRLVFAQLGNHNTVVAIISDRNCVVLPKRDSTRVVEPAEFLALEAERP
jgi:hypothetical protein